MTSDRAAERGRLARISAFVRSPAFLASALLLITILVANGVYLLQIRTNNPVLYHSGLGSPTKGLVTGSYTIDPNDGWTAQALGQLSAQQWMHGHIPLWNPFEGLGQPLAGEMQSAALFVPFIFLQLLPNGIFVMHLALELVAGFSTLLLLRTMKITWAAATCGACLFALNGSFSLMTNAPFNPIAFLPAMLLGVEMIARSAQDDRRPRLGIWVLAMSLALMLMSGFPETAYLEGLFVAAWALVRLITIGTLRKRFVGWLILGAVAGLALAAPALIAFKDFLDFGFTAYHAGSANLGHYAQRQITSFALPYAVGPSGNAVIKVQAGYVTLSAVLIGLTGATSRARRVFHLVLGPVFVVLLLNTFGFGPAQVVLGVLPGMKSILVYKYGLALIEFNVALYVAFAIDDLRGSRMRWRAIATAASLTYLYLLGALVYLHHDHLVQRPNWTAVVVGLTAVTCVALTLLLVAAKRFPQLARVVAATAALIVIVVAAGTYAVPQLSASPQRPVDFAPVRFLQDHLGTSRFYTLGPINPNYGSYRGISELNANDLPVPKSYASFVTDHLSPVPLPPELASSFKPYQLVPFNLSTDVEVALLRAYGQQQQYFRAANVKYVVAQPGVGQRGLASRLGLVRVFADQKVEIWQDTHAAPFYTTGSAGCRMTRATIDAVTATCTSPTTLVRHELFSPGWNATVNGFSTAVADRGSLFQVIDLPAGTSTVSFAYAPPHFVAATVVSLAVLGLAVADGVLFLAVRRRRLPAPQSDPVS